jgi:hypothetical protein
LLHEVPDVGGDEDPALLLREPQELRVLQLSQLRRLVYGQDVMPALLQSPAHDRTGEVNVQH